MGEEAICGNCGYKVNVFLRISILIKKSVVKIKGCFTKLGERKDKFDELNKQIILLTKQQEELELKIKTFENIISEQKNQILDNSEDIELLKSQVGDLTKILNSIEKEEEQKNSDKKDEKQVEIENNDNLKKSNVNKETKKKENGKKGKSKNSTNIICSSCGYENQQDGIFCEKCGTKLK